MSDWDIEVEHQFLSGQDRISNAFLIRSRSEKAPVKKFVAKGPSPHVENGSALAAEWRALSMASADGVRAPSLLFPDQAPQGYLPLEFLSGIDAETAIESGIEPAAVFGLLGKTLRQLHAVEAPYFGGIIDGDAGSWEEVISARFGPRLASVKEFLDPDLYRSLASGIDGSLPALRLEPREPRLIHRDVYLSNFMVSDSRDRSAILDFGMAYFGRPLYDLSKLYILDLYRYPEARDNFLDGYFAGKKAPDSFEPLLRLYLYAELVGMVRFFRAQGQEQAYFHALKVLNELNENRGRIADLLR